jgi:oxygen-independent coproporphyrinogen-3 oxidase
VPERWLGLAEGRGHGEVLPREAVPRGDQLTELLMMGLRLAEGVPLARIEAAAGRPWREAVDARGLERLVEGGFVELDGERRLAATPAGRQRLDALLVALLP